MRKSFRSFLVFTLIWGLFVCFSSPIASKCESAFSSIDEIFRIQLTELTDEQLIKAADAIRAEQRARIKTRICLNCSEMTLFVGKNQKIEATVIELPEGERTPKLEWSTSNKAIATCNNGQVKAIAGGNAVITCSATLTDGTYIYEECQVQVNVPVTSVNTDKKNVKLKGGEQYKPVFTIKPDNASDKNLLFESSKPNIASVNADGTIEGTGTGTATITAKAADGSGKSVSITVNVTDNRIKKEVLKKILMFITCNDVAEDVFTADGNYIDKKKLHNYSYFNSVLQIVSEGEWSTSDGGNTWSVKDFLVIHKIYKGYRQYTFDIRFDGKNYLAENGQVVYASKQKWLDESDPSKYGKNSLSNSEFYPYLIVSPKQIGE